MKMQKVYTPVVRSSKSSMANIAFRLFILVSLVLSTTCLNAQAVSALDNQLQGFQWKDQTTIDQVIQQELTETNAALLAPDVTDWSSAMLEAYRSLLTFTKSEMPGSHDLQGTLDKAFSLMQAETVPHPESRAMVMDDMKAKQVELIQKLTNQ